MSICEIISTPRRFTCGGGSLLWPLPAATLVGESTQTAKYSLLREKLII